MGAIFKHLKRDDVGWLPLNTCGLMQESREAHEFSHGQGAESQLDSRRLDSLEEGLKLLAQGQAQLDAGQQELLARTGSRRSISFTSGPEHQLLSRTASTV